jgi:hypothetical protein
MSDIMERRDDCSFAMGRTSQYWKRRLRVKDFSSRRSVLNYQLLNCDKKKSIHVRLKVGLNLVKSVLPGRNNHRWLIGLLWRTK